MSKNRKGLKVGLKATVTALSLITAIGIVATNILDANKQTISDFLGQPTFKTEIDENAEDADTDYFKTNFKTVAELNNHGEAINKELMQEGAVLLTNKNNCLPLKSNETKLSLFSMSSVDPLYNGGGSGSNNRARKVNYKDAFKAAGFSINEDLYNWYDSKETRDKYARKRGGEIGGGYNITDAPWEAIPSAKDQEADLAIFVLGRTGSEGGDLQVRTGPKSDMTNGNYLELSPTEISVIKAISDNTGEGKRYKKFLVLMNTSNQVETSFLDDYNIDACLWVSTLGSNGSEAVAQILKGEINPSGRLSDLFWKEHYLNPVYANWNHRQFKKPDGNFSGKPYVVYQEGIYNGYRYTETRYEDKLLGRPNTDSSSFSYNYYDAVGFPFGYGLSYTNFEYSDFNIVNYDKAKDEFEFSVKVTNTGSIAGKEAVQLYLQKPYTEYDVENAIEKASVELIDFGKTQILEPSKSEVVTLKAKGKDLACYDSRNKKTFILEKGDYYFTIGKDSHDATNNIIKAKNAAIETSFEGNTTKGNADLVKKHIVEADDFEKYSVDEKTGNKVTNQFDNADLKLYDLDGGNKDKFEYFTRNDWNGTCKLGLTPEHVSLNNEVRLTFSEKLDEEVNSKITSPEKDDVEYPKFGSTETNYQLIDLRVDQDGNPIPFDDPKWDALLNQLTWEEMTTFLSCGVRCTIGIPSIGKPTTIDHNGGVGMNQSFDVAAASNNGYAIRNNDPEKGKFATAYVANSLTASTFNKELVNRAGIQWGEDCLWAGYSGIYGPGINTHRGAYGGRVFEYFSEDPVLGGRLSAELVRGIQSKGIYAYLKHALLNECELERHIVATFANEQSIREIYCKQFELAIKEGGAKAVMTGYNKIGGLFTGRQGFVNSVFHDEFGMTGFAVTDFIPHPTNMIMSALAGNALPDRDFTKQNIYKGYETGYGKLAHALRLETHRILYTVCHSAGMNGYSSNVKMIPITPAWMLVRDMATTTVYTLFGLSIGALLWVYLYEFLDEKFKLEER